MNDLIISILKSIVNNLESGTSYLNEEGCIKVLNTINLMQYGDEEFSKTEAADYLGICRASFDNYVSQGLIPKGISRHKDTKALFWLKSDLDQFIYKQQKFK